jgi:hypothetical protein
MFECASVSQPRLTPPTLADAVLLRPVDPPDAGAAWSTSARPVLLAVRGAAGPRRGYWRGRGTRRAGRWFGGAWSTSGTTGWAGTPTTPGWSAPRPETDHGTEPRPRRAPGRPGHAPGRAADLRIRAGPLPQLGRCLVVPSPHNLDRQGAAPGSAGPRTALRDRVRGPAPGRGPCRGAGLQPVVRHQTPAGIASGPSRTAHRRAGLEVHREGCWTIASRPTGMEHVSQEQAEVLVADGQASLCTVCLTRETPTR